MSRAASRLRLRIARVVAGQPILPFVDGDGSWLVARSAGQTIVFAAAEMRIRTRHVATGDPRRPFRRLSSFYGKLA
jgi:hypothetical protein